MGCSLINKNLVLLARRIKTTQEGINKTIQESTAVVNLRGNLIYYPTTSLLIIFL